MPVRDSSFQGCWAGGSGLLCDPSFTDSYPGPLTFGFFEQLFGELDRLDHLGPREAFAHGEDDSLVQRVQQNAATCVPQLVKRLPVQEPPQVLPALGFLLGTRGEIRCYRGAMLEPLG